MSGSILQSGAVTAGHLSVWLENGTVADAGTAGNGVITEIGITNPGGLALAINNGTISGAYNQLGFIVGLDNNATVEFNAFNGAPVGNIIFDINGMLYPFNPSGSGNITGPSPVINGDLVSFNGTAGNLVQDSGIATTNVALLSSLANKVSAALGTALIGYFQAITGWVGRTLISRLLDSVSVLDFGADPTGVADSTAAFNAGITYLNGLGGGELKATHGNFKIAGTIVMRQGVVLRGAGIQGTILTFANGSSDWITCVGTSYASMMNGAGIERMGLIGSGNTGGRAVFFKYAFNCYMEKVYITNCWTGIEDLSCNTIVLRDVSIAGVLGGPGNWGLYFHAPATGAENNIQITIDNMLINCLWSGADGVVWDGPAYTLNSNVLTCLDVSVGLRVLNTAVSNAFYPEFWESTTFTVDGASNIAVAIFGGANFRFIGGNIQNTSGEAGQGSADTVALEIATDAAGSETHELFFQAVTIGLCKQSAVVTGAKNVKFDACRFGSGVTAPSNTYPAVQVITGAESTLISDCSNWYFGNPNNWAYGVQMDAGSVNTMVIGGDYGPGSLTAPILDNSGDPNTFWNEFIGGTSNGIGPINRPPRYAGPPSGATLGEMYYNTTMNVIQYWNGSAWVTV